MERRLGYDLSQLTIESLAGENNNGENPLKREGLLDDPKECTINVTETCKIGFTVPVWVPKYGGLQCSIEWTYESKKNGMMNYCKDSSSPKATCMFHTCQLNK